MKRAKITLSIRDYLHLENELFYFHMAKHYGVVRRSEFPLKEKVEAAGIDPFNSENEVTEYPRTRKVTIRAAVKVK